MNSNETKVTPMGRVWLIVLGSMVLVAACGSIWHIMGMSEERVKNEKELTAVKTEIVKLTAYRDELLKKASSTDATATSTISIPIATTTASTTP
jgi:hypothetical protein